MLCDKCETNEASDMHECPFEQDVNDDQNPEYCNCCEACTNACHDRI